ncbi:MAG: hypothetical protein II186_08300 [Erysipelotrichales bacterium]|nr:hypothetical protein [Erysipelotrichales bacterium]
MLEEKYIRFIRGRVEERYDMDRFDDSVKALECFYRLDQTIINFEQRLKTMADTPEYDRIYYLQNFNIIEIFMKALYNITHNPAYEISAEEITSADSVSYQELLKTTYQKTPGIAVSSENPYDHLNDGYKKEYLMTYRFRNVFTHQSNPIDPLTDKPVTQKRIEEVIADALVCYLDLAYEYRNALFEKEKELQRSTYLNRKAYCEKIIRDYETWTQDFTYVDIAWNTKDSVQNDVSVEEILTSSVSNIKLIGEAGTGKTTALKRIEYIQACRLKEHPGGKIPVFIALNDVKPGKKILSNKVAEELEITLKQANELISHNEIIFLLDGYNEILDTPLKRSLAGEIDAMALQNRKLKIILSDRNIAKNTIPVLTKAKNYMISPLSLEKKLDFMEKNCDDAEITELIRKDAAENPETYRPMKTPLALMHFIEAVRKERTIPLNPTEVYLKLLFEREQDLKKDPNMEYLPYYLQALAVSGRDQLSREAALEIIAAINRLKGFTHPDSLSCLNLALDMGILQPEDNERVSFSSLTYQMYFMESCHDERLKQVVHEYFA